MSDSGFEIPNDPDIAPNAIQPNADLSRADLNRANLSGGNLEEADLSEANLQDADLSGARLSGADLSQTYLTGADLSGSKLMDADLSVADLSFADLSGADLQNASLSGANLEGADLSKGNFRDADMADVNLKDADLSEANLRSADLSETDLRYTDFSETDLMYTTLTGVDLRGTTLSGMNLRGSNITDADLRGANVDDVLMTATTTCNRLYEGYDAERYLPRPVQRFVYDSDFSVEEWDDTVRAYDEIKTAFSDNALIGKAQKMHVGERRARSHQAKESGGLFSWDYLSTLPSRFITGYGVRLRTLSFWMLLLFSGSTALYLDAGIRDTTSEILAYSVLAFTVAPPPPLPSGAFIQSVVMIETFFGTLSTVLLGYILGNRERV